MGAKQLFLEVLEVSSQMLFESVHVRAERNIAEVSRLCAINCPQMENRDNINFPPIRLPFSLCAKTGKYKNAGKHIFSTHKTMRFSGKVAIVTGSSAGIGQATVLRLASEGAKVVVHGRNAEKIQATLRLLDKMGIRCEDVLAFQGEIQDDVFIEYLVKRTIEKFGKIDILVNNAGLGGAPGMDPNSMETYDYIQDVNVKSVMKLTNIVLPHLEKTRGNVVNAPPMLYYAMSKAALDHFMRSKTEEFAQKGVRINCVNPGYIITDFLKQMDVPSSVEHKLTNGYNATNPLGRSGIPSDIAKPIAFLASDDACYVTGVALTVDGGQVMKSALVNPS
uniref:Short-chain dehydrogenease/reductase-like protein n=1 Tax=Steinernema glaseri TaxID=37863 RepID=A0A1I8AQ58_9BILA